ncbi:MAG: MFS transporter, partial [Candidatus Bathyarchaeia archaeon]
KRVLRFLRLSLITLPVTYARSPNREALIAISAFWGFAWATGQASVVPYLLDVTPEEHRGSFIAIYNLTIGVTTFFGSLFGGYLSDYLIGIYGLMLGLQIVYGLSLAGRTLGVALHFTLKESLKP